MWSRAKKEAHATGVRPHMRLKFCVAARRLANRQAAALVNALVFVLPVHPEAEVGDLQGHRPIDAA